jgi:hypothetical protein
MWWLMLSFYIHENYTYLKNVKLQLAKFYFNSNDHFFYMIYRYVKFY